MTVNVSFDDLTPKQISLRFTEIQEVHKLIYLASIKDIDEEFWF